MLTHDSGVGGAAAFVRALRVTLACGIDAPEWVQFLERRLRESVRSLSGDGEFLADVGAFNAAERRFSRKNASRAPSALRHLQRFTTLDTLHFALWGFAKRQGVDIAHPVELSVLIEKVSFAMPETLPAVRRLLGQESIASLAEAWGARPMWLRGRSTLRRKGPFRPGCCSLLQLMRSRWVEAVSTVARAKPSLDAADERVRSALMSWQFAGRDCGARWLSFAVPNSDAIQTLVGGSSGVVELGAGNGYWAELASDTGLTVTALDTSPPPQLPDKVRVLGGTADNLVGLTHDTLLLCMPPPGEAACCEVALDNFSGSRVVYIGEWGSGMTGTRTFHHRLVNTFKLERRIELPRWPKLAVELFVFSRAATKQEGSDLPGKDALPTCDVCGRGGKLWRCPWSRWLRVCSAACFEASDERHLALLAIAFCGAPTSSRVAFEEWEPCKWLEHGFTTKAEWESLRAATPQSDTPPR